MGEISPVICHLSSVICRLSSNDYLPVVVKLSVETYAFALLFAFIFILKMMKLLALELEKLQPVDSFPLMPTDCQSFATVTTVVSLLPHCVTSDPVLLYIS